MQTANSPNTTSLSLLKRVRRFEPDAWVRLSALYGPMVYGWCRRAGMQGNDAADAVQEVFRSVFQGIAQFRGTDGSPEGGSFRGWLWTVTRNHVRQFFRRKQNNPQAVGGTDALIRFAAQAEIERFLSDSEPDALMTQRRLLHRALDLIRKDFNQITWTAFSRIALENRDVQDVAKELGLTENAVRQAKFRVLRRLREELDDV